MSINSACSSEWEGAPLVVKPKVAWRMLACSNTHGYELLNAGELVSFLDGRARKITVDSIHAYIARKLAKAGTTLPVAQTAPQPRKRGRPRKELSDVTRRLDELTAGSSRKAAP
jgi:hypothetical protein